MTRKSEFLSVDAQTDYLTGFLDQEVTEKTHTDTSTS